MAVDRTWDTLMSGAPARPQSDLALALTIALLVLPWIWPFATGPSASVMPWLVSCACCVAFLAVAMVCRVDISLAASRAWLVVALLSSVIALLQYFGVSAHFRPWINVAPLGEAFGNLRQRNQFATLTNMGLAVLLFAGWQRYGGRIRSQSSRGPHENAPAGRTPTGNIAQDQSLGSQVLVAHRQVAERSEFFSPSLGRLGAAKVGGAFNGPASASTALLALANAATLSRTGLIQLLSLPILALLWRRSLPARRWYLLGLALLVYVAASLLLPWLIGRDPLANGIGSRFRSPGQPCEGRWLLWENVAYLIGQKPWWGWGWGELDYAHFITLYPAGRFCDILDNAHNLPLHLAVVWGIPVSVLICGLMAWLVLRARPWREPMPVRQIAWAVLAMIGLHSMLEYPLWYGPFQMATAIAVWTLWRTRPRVAADDGATAAGRPQSAPWFLSAPVIGAVATLALAALAYAAWDYHRVSQIYLPPEQRSSAYRDDTLVKVQASWLFRDQVRFATLTLSTVTPENATDLYAMARALLHFSPEARVVEKLIDSALMLDRRDEAAWYMLRFRTAFPTEYARWQARHSGLPELPPGTP